MVSSVLDPPVPANPVPGCESSKSADWGVMNVDAGSSRGTALLGDYLDLLQWSPERLAREINRVCGLGTISPKAPYGWLRGAHPRGRLPRVVAEVLTQHLGRRVMVEDLWPGRSRAKGLIADGGLDLPWTSSGTTAAVSLAENDHVIAEDRLRPVNGAAIVSYATDWLINTTDASPSRTHGDPMVPQMADALDARINDLRRMDDGGGGAIVLDWASHDLRWAVQLVRRGAYDALLGARLYAIVAQLAQLTGWLAFDAGRHREAQWYWFIGLRAAHTAGDRGIGASIVSCLSYQCTWKRRPEAAVLAKIARSGARDVASPVVHALLATRQARAHAMLGEKDACARALDDAARQTAMSPHNADPAWAYWVTPAVLAADAGRAWLDLGDRARAEKHLVEGIRLFGSTQPRNRALHQASLAQARLEAGDVDGAHHAATTAIDLAATVPSIRTRTRLRALRDAFSQIDAIVARETVSQISEIVAG